MIAIVNYGLGNLGSIFNMLRKIGIESRIVSNPEELAASRKIILPGVGHFDRAMERLHQSQMREALDHKGLVERVPVLGICLGMQLMTRGSEEGSTPGLGWISGSTVRFHTPPGLKLKVPHMGWNVVERATASPLTEGFNGEIRFYFVHSYHVKVDDPKDSILQTNYGVVFNAAIQKDNIFGVQFHPEKSHRFGMQLLKNFARI